MSQTEEILELESNHLFVQDSAGNAGEYAEYFLVCGNGEREDGKTELIIQSCMGVTQIPLFLQAFARYCEDRYGVTRGVLAMILMDGNGPEKVREIFSARVRNGK
ncbi:MAG: hypothetical protein LBD02_10675 [Christensenellaceae bacterium]|nr:hypothetical protein [Christensenellaceae bacterium]